MVRNDFRHHWNTHRPEKARVSRIVIGVLNAFRHHWNSHFAQEFYAGETVKCSTPFGIIGIRTDVPGKLFGLAGRGAQRLSASLEFALSAKPFVMKNCLCAQRLSASLEFAPIWLPIVTVLLLCSTPFGI